MTHASRHLARALTAICLGATGTTVLAAAPSVAAPSVDQAESRVDKLTHDRKVVFTKTTTSRKSLADARRDLGATRARMTSYRTALVEVRQQVAALESAPGAPIDRALNAAAEVTTAPDPAEALDAAQAQFDEDSDAPETQKSLEERLAELQATADRQASRVRVLTVRNQTAAKKLREVKIALARANQALEDARAAQEPVAPAVPEASGGAAAAVAYAMAQVGDAYVYGAAGPDAFDCSGLTMAAWAQGGVSLPHSSGAQMGSGTPVSIDALQPGDLVFYYSPVSHVGMYIGNGQIVHAANPGTGVQVAPVSSMPISGAVRPG